MGDIHSAPSLQEQGEFVMLETSTISAGTLPARQSDLVSLRPEQASRLANAGCERLFDVSDVLVVQVANFARSHGCSVVWDSDGPTFLR
jgi:hypothetical protein